MSVLPSGEPEHMRRFDPSDLQESGHNFLYVRDEPLIARIVYPHPMLPVQGSLASLKLFGGTLAAQARLSTNNINTPLFHGYAVSEVDGGKKIFALYDRLDVRHIEDMLNTATPDIPLAELDAAYTRMFELYENTLLEGGPFFFDVKATDFVFGRKLDSRDAFTPYMIDLDPETGMFDADATLSETGMDGERTHENILLPKAMIRFVSSVQQLKYDFPIFSKSRSRTYAWLRRTVPGSLMVDTGTRTATSRLIATLRSYESSANSNSQNP